MKSIAERGLIIVYSTVDFVYYRSFFDFYSDLRLGMESSHYFCGRNTIEGADCPNCNKKLTLLFTLDTSDPHVEELLPLGPSVPFLYCFPCGLHEDIFYYKLTESGINVLQCATGPECEDQPYSGFRRDFPGCPAYLLELSEEAQVAIDRINRDELASGSIPVHLKIFDDPAHQVGGRPFLSNTYHETVPCIACDRNMNFLASIADECLHPVGFTGDAGSQIMFHCCRHCKVIAAFAQSD